MANSYELPDNVRASDVIVDSYRNLRKMCKEIESGVEVRIVSAFIMPVCLLNY